MSEEKKRDGDRTRVQPKPEPKVQRVWASSGGPRNVRDFYSESDDFVDARAK